MAGETAIPLGHDPVGVIRRHLLVRSARQLLGSLPDQAQREREHRLGGSLAGQAQVEGVVLKGD